MYSKFKNAFQLIRTMGLGYVAFRAWYEFTLRTGLLKRKFPSQVPIQEHATLNRWKESTAHFFPLSPRFTLPPDELSHLKRRVQAIKQGRLSFFGSQEYEVTDWHTNPATGYRYNASHHWTMIPDFSAQAGDIKYVWEKSRFAFLYDLIRYDFHFQEDQSALVFSEIDSWIAANPVNLGPNWRCSQEISLRILNWTFALHYYKDSAALTPKRFALILHSLYWQIRHVETNIQFSRKAVRNNHALTETLTLYLVGLLFPFFPESTRWKQQGKRWFEQEVGYQVYEDGTFLQFSMNYHRVVVQLLTWGVRLAHLNGEKWAPVVYERARRSLRFLQLCQDTSTGWLPNYGNNDGALFFPLSECHFRDFRPQLAALAAALGEYSPYGSGLWHEESAWLGTDASPAATPLTDAAYSFTKSGYFVLRDTGSLTFLRCGHYKDRPFQADNLHLDLWDDGVNILRDAGSYLYNTDDRWTRYFAGTASHNTVKLAQFDQMRKGPRFIWYNWIKESHAGWYQNQACVFEGHFTGFRHCGRDVTHRRRVTKLPGASHWIIEDWLHNAPPGLPMHQLWHPIESFFEKYSLEATDQSGQQISGSVTEEWYSEKYGQKEMTLGVVFSTSQRYIKTELRRNS